MEGSHTRSRVGSSVDSDGLEFPRSLNYKVRGLALAYREDAVQQFAHFFNEFLMVWNAQEVSTTRSRVWPWRTGKTLCSSFNFFI